MSAPNYPETRTPRVRAEAFESEVVRNDSILPSLDSVPQLGASKVETERGIAGPEASEPRFVVVPVADLDEIEPSPPVYAWQGLAPSGHVTLVAAHGGVGKTTVSLMLATCIAAGQPLFGIPVRSGSSVFYSGEDGAGRLRDQVRGICRELGLSSAQLDGRLHLLDATVNPTLFTEQTISGRREGVTTSTYSELRSFLDGKNVRVLIIDNASDVFDASEIERAKVRTFMRALASIARDFDLAVILLAHVDKWTSRGERTGTEGYTGSTAWHNSARSRLFMSREKDRVCLHHQKHNLGPLHDPIQLIWPTGRIPRVEQECGTPINRNRKSDYGKVVLRLIEEFSTRGEHVSAATTSRSHAGKLLRQEPTFPPIKSDGELFGLLRELERAGHLQRISVRGADRKPRSCWQVTTAGKEYSGSSAATAATAATSHVTAEDAVPA